mgnify:CR=1 FL=1
MAYYKGTSPESVNENIARSGDYRLSSFLKGLAGGAEAGAQMANTASQIKARDADTAAKKEAGEWGKKKFGKDITVVGADGKPETIVTQDMSNYDALAKMRFYQVGVETSKAYSELHQTMLVTKATIDGIEREENRRLIQPEKVAAEVAAARQDIRSLARPLGTAVDAANSAGSNFDPEGRGYDYGGAYDAGAKPDASGHWQSLDPRTGMVLKGAKHESFWKTKDVEDRMGNEVVKGPDGRYYSRRKSPETRDLEYMHGYSM